MRHHRLQTHTTLLVCLLGTFALSGCDPGTGQTTSALPMVPSALVTSVERPTPSEGAPEYDKLKITALNPADGSVRWRYQTDWHPWHQIRAPVVADGIVFIPSDPIPTNPRDPSQEAAGNLVALGERDGQQLWSVPVGWLASAPVVGGGVVYVSGLRISGGSGSGGALQEVKSFYALRASDGHQLWRSDFPFREFGVNDTLQLVDGTLYGTSNQVCFDSCNAAYLFACDPASGKLRWRTTIPGDLTVAPPAIASGMLYVKVPEIPGESVANLTAYRASDGKQAWTVPGAYGGGPLVDGGHVYALTVSPSAASTPQQSVFDTQVIALDGRSGQQLWQVKANPTNKVPGALLAVRGDTVYIQTGPPSGTAQGGDRWRLEGLDAQSGQARWSAPLQLPLDQALLTETTLYGSSSFLWPGQVMGLGAADGHLIWSAPIGTQQQSSSKRGGFGHIGFLTPGDGVLYVGFATANSVMLAAIQMQDGTPLWTAEIDGLYEVTVVE